MDADRRKRWWSYLQLDPVIGGGFIERWTGPAGESMVTMGSVLEVTANRILRLTWSDDNWPVETEVEIILPPTPGGTLVRVRHSGFERLTEPTAAVSQQSMVPAGSSICPTFVLLQNTEDQESAELDDRLEVEPSDVV